MAEPTRTVTNPTGISLCGAGDFLPAAIPGPAMEAIRCAPLRVAVLAPKSAETPVHEMPIPDMEFLPGACAYNMTWPPSYNPKRPKSGRGYPRGQRA